VLKEQAKNQPVIKGEAPNEITDHMDSQMDENKNEVKKSRSIIGKSIQNIKEQRQ
jgi:hypothetical protein